MPHLSPMSWITLLLVFWMSVFTLISLTWWSILQAFPKIEILYLHEYSTNWKWLQDGRVLNYKL